MKQQNLLQISEIVQALGRLRDALIEKMEKEEKHLSVQSNSLARIAEQRATLERLHG